MNLKTNLKKAAVVTGLCMSMLLTACNSSGNGASSSTGGKSGQSNSSTLKVGMECDYAPFNWTTTKADNGVKLSSGGYAGGYDVEIAKRIAKDMGKKLEIVKTEWNGLTPSLTSGKIDLIIAGMSPTAERKKTINFSDTYYNSDLVIVVKKDSKFASAKNISDFSGAKITGQLNTFHYKVIDQIKCVNKVTAMETFPAMIVALQSGKIDGYISERPGALSAVNSNKDLTFVSFGKGNGFKAKKEDTAIAVGVSKKNKDLLNKVNASLKKISEEERQNIMKEAVKNQPLGE